MKQSDDLKLADNETINWKGTVVFFSMDALGHIHPILSIVKELRRRHYRAIILTTRPLNGAQRLESRGFELQSCAEAKQEQQATSEDALREIMQPLIENFRKGCKEAYVAGYELKGAVGKHLDDMIENHDLIEAKLRSIKPDLIVYDHVIGIPCVTTVAKRWARVYSGFPSALYSSLNDNFVAGLGLRPDDQMTAEWREFERETKSLVRQKIRDFWASKEQPDWPLDLDLTPTSPHLNLYFGPRELGLEQIEKFKPIEESGWFRLEHTIDDSGDDSLKNSWKLPAELVNVPGKLIYFSLGTLVTCDIELINRLLKILSKSKNKFIVSMGQMHKHIDLYDNMWGERFIDQKAVLKKADLFITHGGHNSIIEAFYYGVPGLIVLPVFADQFDSAQRVQDCGFGHRLNPFNCSEDDLLSSIDKLLLDNELAKRMKAVGKRLRSIKYHEIAVDKLEPLIS